MWRKPSDPKAPLSAGEAEVPPAPKSTVERPAESRSVPRVDGSQVSRSITIKGEITGQTDLYLDGQVEGTIRLPGACVTIGPNGRVTAEVEAREIILEGYVRGRLEARERVQVRRSGSLTGDIVAPRVAIEEGAILRGRIEMPQPGEAKAVRTSTAAREELRRPIPLEASN